MKKSNAGFTVIELTIALAIAALVVIALFSTVINRFVEIRRIDARSNMQIDARNILQVIGDDLKQANAIDPEPRWNDNNEPSDGWSSNSNTLIVASPAFDDNEDPLFIDPNQYITHNDNHIYYLSNNSIYRRIVKNPVANNAAITTCPPAQATQDCPADREIGTDVADINFSYHDAEGEEVTDVSLARSVRIELTIEQEIYSTPETLTRSIEIVMRNQ